MLFSSRNVMANLFQLLIFSVVCSALHGSTVHPLSESFTQVCTLSAGSHIAKFYFFTLNFCELWLVLYLL